MLIRKYPALFHYIINLDLEKDLNEIQNIIDITKVTDNQNVALLIHLIENRANHSFQLRQDLYNLLKSKSKRVKGRVFGDEIHGTIKIYNIVTIQCIGGSILE